MHLSSRLLNSTPRAKPRAMQLLDCEDDMTLSSVAIVESAEANLRHMPKSRRRGTTIDEVSLDAIVCELFGCDRARLPSSGHCRSRGQ